MGQDRPIFAPARSRSQGPLSDQVGDAPNPRGQCRSLVKGFGCRPVVTYLRAQRAGVRKPPRKEPAGAGRQFPAYGDLTMRRLALGMRWPA